MTKSLPYMAMLRAFLLPPVALVAAIVSYVAAQHLLKVLVFGLPGVAPAPGQRK